MKLAICNDFFQGWEEEEIFRFVSEIGYDGIEIAPFMYADDVGEISSSVRKGIRAKAADYGLEIVGLHWALVGPEGLHLTHPDPKIRLATRDYLIKLISFCGDIGGRVIIFGSPKQRNLLPGVQLDEAYQYAARVFRECMQYAAEREVVICIEPLGENETNFITGITEAIRLVEMVDHPNFQTMVDIKAALTEERPLTDIIEEAWEHLWHFHLNDQDGLAPGYGSAKFGPIINQLKAQGYNNYLSLEIFKRKTGIAETARGCYNYLQRLHLQ